MKKIAVFLLFLTVTVMSFAAEQETQLDPLQKRASSGDVAAQLEIGKEYFKGVKRPLNRALALYYFNLVALTETGLRRLLHYLGKT